MKELFNDLKSIRISISTKYLALIAFIIYLPFMVQALNGADNATNGYIRKFHEYGWEDAQGRFLIHFFDLWRNSWIPRVLIVALCIILLCIMSQLICNILEIKGTFIELIVGAFIVFAPSTANLLTYYYCADSYCFAYLLISIASYLLIKKSSWSARILAILLMIISMSIYQAYVGFSVILILIYWLKMILKTSDSQDNSSSFKKLNLNSLIGIVCVGISMIGYAIIFKLLGVVHYLYPTSTRGMNNMLGSVLDFPKNLLTTYKAFLQYFFTCDLLNNDFFARRVINLIIFAFIISIIIYEIITRKIYKNVLKTVLSIAIVLIMPIAFCLIVIIAPNASIYSETGMLMLPYMNLIYILPIALIDGGESKIIHYGYNIIASISLIVMVVFIELFASMIEIEQAQMTSVSTLIVNDIDKLTDGNHEIPVLITGRLRDGNYPFPDSELESVCKGMVSRYGLVYSTDEQISEGWINYIRYYVGVYYSYPDELTRNTILDSSSYSEMPIYPSAGSVKKIDDVVVVRLSIENFR